MRPRFRGSLDPPDSLVPRRPGRVTARQSLAETVGPIVQAVQREQRPLLIALAERMAAQRYRGWAGQADQVAHRSDLLACADREEEIARRVESLDPRAESIQKDLLAEHPDLDAVYESLFAGLSTHAQFAIQAGGERLGAATWRSLAGEESRQEARQTFLACAVLEEESAAVLESIVATPAGRS